MIFNKSKKYDFPPEFCFQNEEILDVVEETRLLGQVLTSDLKWYANTKSIYSKAISKMWLLRRMKIMQMDPKIIFDYYQKEIKVLAEQGVIIWNSGLTKGQERDLEKIQKVAFKIILADDYGSYELALSFCGAQKLTDRRLQLCTNFAIKLYKSEKSEEYFTLADRIIETRQDAPLVVEQKVNTKRCYNAPHNYLARLVNANSKTLKNKP